MAYVSAIAMALATPPCPSLDSPKPGDDITAVNDHSGRDKQAAALPTPPTSVSPNLVARGHHADARDPPPMDIGHEEGLDGIEELPDEEDDGEHQASKGMPLSRGALSGLDASAAITPSMLAKHHLPGIMLGNGPRPIRYVMGELTHCVPGFSRIPSAKARRLVVAALESRQGGGPNGNITFCKTGWGRWDAHLKGSSRDSGIGSFNEGNLSPPRSERSGYAMSYGDSAVHMPGMRMPSGYRDQHSGGSWTASSLREEDELDVDMDALEHEAEKMSLDGASLDDDTDDFDDATDEDDNSPPSKLAPRKALLPTPSAPRKDYNAISVAYARRWSSKGRRPSGLNALHSASLPTGASMRTMRPSYSATPEEQAAAAALLSMGSM